MKWLKVILMSSCLRVNFVVVEKGLPFICLGMTPDVLIAVNKGIMG